MAKKRPSDKDTGYPWGKAGKKAAKKRAAKRNSGYGAWTQEGKRLKAKKRRKKKK